MILSDVDGEKLFGRYQDLQRYVHWTADDVRRIRSAAPLLEPSIVNLIDDFYEEISRHREAHQVITGGEAQIKRLKRTLQVWVTELLSGQYDEQYVTRRWRVGLRHVEIGLNQVYTNAALSRLRSGLLNALRESWDGNFEELLDTRMSINKLLDLDLAIIEDAYQSAFLERQQRTERLIAIGQMAGGVAHELRNPLNVVKTSVYYLLHARNPSAEKTEEHLRRIERQVGLADKVITALSDFAKLPFPNVKPVHVEFCIGEALELTGLPAQIQVETNVERDTPAILADPDQMRIVLINLFRNANDAMPQGGTLSIRAEAENGFVDILVSDTGQGISREALAKVMEPLFSTKTRGLGLGLAITRAIVEKHRGELLVKSRVGAGSTFTVRLPAAAPHSESHDP